MYRHVCTAMCAKHVCASRWCSACQSVGRHGFVRSHLDSGVRACVLHVALNSDVSIQGLLHAWGPFMLMRCMLYSCDVCCPQIAPPPLPRSPLMISKDHSGMESDSHRSSILTCMILLCQVCWSAPLSVLSGYNLRPCHACADSTIRVRLNQAADGQ